MCIIGIQKTGVWKLPTKHLPGKEQMQFEVTYNDARGMVTVSTATIDATKVPHATMRDSV